jgi:hypothetical protein
MRNWTVVSRQLTRKAVRCEQVIREFVFGEVSAEKWLWPNPLSP